MKIKDDQKYNVGQTALVIGVLALVARLLGFLRQFLFASSFGLGTTLDVYLTAFRIPDTIFNILILGTLSAAFIPVFTKIHRRDPQEAQKLASNVFNSTLLLVGLFCLIAFIFATPLYALLVPGFDAEKLAATVKLARLLLLSPIIFAASNIFSGILMSHKRFLTAQLSAIFYNVGILFGLLALYPKLGMTGLGLGVIIGSLMHAGVQVPQLIHLGYKWKAILNFKDKNLKQIITLTIPRIFSLDPTLISLLIASNIASFLSAGTIASYTLAQDLIAVPLGLFAISTAIAVFPALSDAYSESNLPDYLAHLKNSIVQTLTYIIPISICFLLYRAHIVRIIYGHGKVDWQQTIVLFTILGILSFSLVALSLIPILSRAFYARHNTLTPVLVGLVAIVSHAVISYDLSHQYGVYGIAYGFVTACILNAILLVITLFTELRKEPGSGALRTFSKNLINAASKLIVGALVLGAVAYGSLYLVAPILNTQTTLGIFLQVGISVSFGLVAYLIVLNLLKFETAQKLTERFKAMFA